MFIRRHLWKILELSLNRHIVRSLSSSSSILCCTSHTAKAKTPTSKISLEVNEVIVGDVSYKKDAWCNLTPKLLSHAGRNLHLQPGNPLSMLKRRIVNFFYKKYPSRSKSPLFSCFDNLNPVVTKVQNFDSLLVPLDHPSRAKSDCYYINEDHLFRAHTSAHQSELIRMGMNNFLVVGDVYRRDEIDKKHYPVFHQLEGVRLMTKHEIFRNDKLSQELPVFELNGERTAEKQEVHTLDAVFIMTQSLKVCLNELCQDIFGKDVEIRWVDAYFPFTHPSWEIEVKLGDEWLEILGCGIMEHKILANSGAGDKIGWAFGLGLERIAMKLYAIPDIRLFWSSDTGFLHQFRKDDPYAVIKYKAVSEFPQCVSDMSFWLPEDGIFNSADYYDLVRSVGGDIVEQVSLLDEFHHKKKKRWSQCYRIVYRHMQKTLSQEEVNKIHKLIAEAATKDLRVEIR